MKQKQITYDFSGKVALVTAAAKGIGQACAMALAESGANIILGLRHKESGKELVERIRKTGVEVLPVQMDVSSMSQIKRAVQEGYDHFKRIDILINNAGITRDRTLEKMSEEEWDSVIDVNLKGVFICTQAVVPYMKANKWGRIVSAASNVGLRGNFGQTNYAATKAGVIAMAKTWTMEFGKYGITANAIAPGFTMTDMVNKIPEEHFAKIKESIPLRTVAQPLDIAYGYLYLASDESKYVNGSTYVIDGNFVF